MATPPEYRQVDDERDGLTLRDYLGVLWRRKWVIILVTVVATAAAFGFSYRQAKVYEAQADLIYEQQLDVANPLTGQSYTDPTQRTTELTSVNAIIQSPNITNRVTSSLEAQGLPTSGYEVRAEVAQDQGAATATQASNVVSVIATSGDAEYSAAVAQTYADQFVDWRQQRMSSQIQAAIDAVDKELRNYSGAEKQSSDYLILQQRLRDLQILKATATGNFRVLVPATVPEAPIEPQPLRSAILGFGGRPLRRHRARLPARAVRHARAAAGRRRGAAAPAGARARAAPLARADQVTHPGHSRAPRGPRRPSRSGCCAPTSPSWTSTAPSSRCWSPAACRARARASPSPTSP